MKKLRSVLVFLAAAAIASCGGGGGGSGILSPAATTAATVAALQIIASALELPSDKTGASKVDLTVIVRDASNNVIENVPVTISASSGALLVTSGTTDENGRATAELTNGLNPQNRVITITASAGGTGGSGGVTATLDINVVGTTLVITGPAALALGNTGTYTAVLKDSEGAGIAGSTVTFTSANGNVLSVPTGTTNSAGNVSTNLTAGTAGASNGDRLTATALGLSTPFDIGISGDAFGFIAPSAGTEIPLGTPQVVQVRWLQGGSPVANGSTVEFSSTRGTVSGVTTTSGGVAQATVTSSTAGSATVTARDPATNTTATLTIEFVATTPATIDLQAFPFTVPVSGESTLTAVVRDANQQLVKNANVKFEILSDTSGNSQIAPGTDLTDSLGVAESVYNAGPNATAQNGVRVRAYIGDPSAPTAQDEVQVTVAQQSLFISLGTGNDLFEPTTATFAKEWNVIVTDSVGNAVANKNVQVSLNSTQYRKGAMRLVTGTGWVLVQGVDYIACPDEDLDRDGILDGGEDLNASNRIEAGNIATVAAVPPGASASDPCGSAGAGGTSASVLTNSQGLARLCVIYPQDHNLWVKARIEAKASVSGSEFARGQTFVLDAKAQDLNNENATPPGEFSPFGQVLDCSNTN